MSTERNNENWEDKLSQIGLVPLTKPVNFAKEYFGDYSAAEAAEEALVKHLFAAHCQENTREVIPLDTDDVGMLYQAWHFLRLTALQLRNQHDEEGGSHE